MFFNPNTFVPIFGNAVIVQNKTLKPNTSTSSLISEDIIKLDISVIEKKSEGKIQRKNYIQTKQGKKGKALALIGLFLGSTFLLIAGLSAIGYLM